MMGGQLLQVLLWVPMVSAAFKAMQAAPLDLKKTLLPDEDPFYKAPPGYENAKLGDVLRWRAVPNDITLNNKDAVKPKNAWQIQYRTQTGAGDPEANIVTVLEPYNADPSKLFVYHWFSDACYNGCNPSITMQIGTRRDNEYTQLQSLLTIGALSQGWWVSVADDTGPQAAYGSGLHTAHATLDSMRAIKNAHRIIGIDEDPTIGTYGYSGGGLSAGWTAEMQPSYAPELKIAGIAMGGIIPNTSALVDSFNKHARASYGPPIIMGLTKDYKNLSDWVNANVKDDQRAHLYQTTKQCFDSNYDNYTNMDLGTFFKDGYESLHTDLPWGVFHWSGTMGLRGTPKVPLYLYESIADDASPIEFADALYKKWCDAGSSIKYVRNLTPLNHSEEMIAGVGDAIAWVKERFEGKPADVACSSTNVQKGYLQALTDPTLLGALFDDLGAYMGYKIGPAQAPSLPMLLPFPKVAAGKGVAGRGNRGKARSTFSLGEMLAKVLNPFSGLGSHEPSSVSTVVPDLITGLAPGLVNVVGGVEKGDEKQQAAAAGVALTAAAPESTGFLATMGKVATGILSVPAGLISGAWNILALPVGLLGGGVLAAPIQAIGSWSKSDGRQRLVGIDDVNATTPASNITFHRVPVAAPAPVNVTSRVQRRLKA